MHRYSMTLATADVFFFRSSSTSQSSQPIPCPASSDSASEKPRNMKKRRAIAVGFQLGKEPKALGDRCRELPCMSRLKCEIKDAEP